MVKISREHNNEDNKSDEPNILNELSQGNEEESKSGHLEMIQQIEVPEDHYL